MLDFVSIKAELDEAGTDLHKIEEIYARVHAEIEAAPAAGSYQPAGRPTSHIRLVTRTRDLQTECKRRFVVIFFG